MKRFFISILSILLIAAGSFFMGTKYYHYSPFYHSITKAVAVVYPTENNSVSGVVTFEQHKDGLYIFAALSGLAPGTHGFHIHEFGDCSCADATCAGSHFNPTGHKHGIPNKVAHVGDLGNIIADENGNTTYQFISKLAQLNGPHAIIGRSVIVHKKADDLQSQPTGNAGARVGCGVIGIAK